MIEQPPKAPQSNESIWLWMSYICYPFLMVLVYLLVANFIINHLQDESIFVFVSLIIFPLAFFLLFTIVRIKLGAPFKRIMIEVAAMFILVFLLMSQIVPSIFSITQRVKQKGTIADMQIIRQKMDEYKNSHGSYPVIERLDQIESLLQQKMPTADKWGNDFFFQSTGDGYWLISYGTKGEPDLKDLGSYKEQVAVYFENDIVLRNGVFIQYPEGMGGLK